MKKVIIVILVIFILAALLFTFNEIEIGQETIESVNQTNENNFQMIVYTTSEICTSLEGQVQGDNLNKRCIINEKSYIISDGSPLKFEIVRGESYEAICNSVEGELQMMEQSNQVICIDNNGITYWADNQNYLL